LYVPADADALLMLVPALAFHEVAIAVIGSEEMGSDRVLHTVGTNLEGAVLPAPEAAAEPPHLPQRPVTRTPTEDRLASAGYAGARRVLDALAESPPANPDALRKALRAHAAADSTSAAGAASFLVIHNGHTEPLRTP